MTTADSVLLPAPFGPITACTSPDETVRSMPLRICLPATDGSPTRSSDLAAVRHLATVVHVDLDHAVDDLATYTGTGCGGRQGLRLAGHRLNVLPCFQHSISTLVAPHLALAERESAWLHVSPIA